MAGKLKSAALPTKMKNRKMSGPAMQTKLRGQVGRVGVRISDDRKRSR